MNYQDLPRATRAIKIREFDKDTNSKVIASVKWSKLGGNKDAYLSVQIEQVKYNGEVLQSYEKDTKEVISKISTDIAALLDCHLVNLASNRLNSINNSVLVDLNQCKACFGKTMYTSEQRNIDIANLRSKLQDHELFKVVFNRLGDSLKHSLIEYINETSDRFKYPSVDRSFKHWDQQVKKRYDSGRAFSSWEKADKKTGRSPQSLLLSYFEDAEKLSEMLKTHYHNLPSEKDINTPEKFAKRYDVTILEAYEMIACTDSAVLEEKTNSIVEKGVKTTKQILDKLTEKYNIPVVFG